MQRRRFLKMGCTICLLTAAGGIMPFAAEANAKLKPYKAALNEQHQAEIPLGLFTDTNLNIIRVKGLYFDIALHKDEAGLYNAYLMKCTHMDNQLYLTPDGFRCSLHGSEYDKTGNVLKGPAEMPLNTLITAINEEYIFINIPKNEE